MSTSAPYKVYDIIFDAMSQVGAIQADEAPQPFEQNLCLRRLNFMLDRWSAQRLLLRSFTSFNYLLTAGQATYQIGPSPGIADWVGSKPIKIRDGAFIRDTSNTDYGLEQITKAEWNQYGDKAITTDRPQAFYYDPGAAQQGPTGVPGLVNPSLGTIGFYMTPDGSQSYTFYFDCDCYLTEFTSVDQIVTFEPAYFEALYSGLAARIYRDFNEHAREIPADIISLAANSLRTIKDLNATQVVARIDSIGGKGGIFNIWNNEYLGGGN